MTEQTAVAISTQAAVGLMKRRFGRELTTLADSGREKLVILIQQGFNPFTDLAIYEHQPYVLIDGWYNAVQRAGRRIGRMPTRPVTDDERKDYGLSEDEVGVICTLYLASDTEPFATGFGKASREKPYRNNPVERQNPYRQAEKRSEGQVLRKTLRMVGMVVPDVGTMAEGVVVESTARDVTDEEGALPPKWEEQQQSAPPAPPRRTGVAVEEPLTDAASSDDLMAKAAKVATLGALYNFAMESFGKARYPDRLTILNRLGRRMNAVTDADAPELARRLVEITTGRLV